jgi:hypothetical protein
MDSLRCNRKVRTSNKACKSKKEKVRKSNKAGKGKKEKVRG